MSIDTEIAAESLVIEQIYLDCLSQASYLIADTSSGTAAIIDPRRDTEIYIDRAKALNVKIEHVILTHVHADFVAGHLELQELTGAIIYMGKESPATFDFKFLEDGDTIELGDVELLTLETPGHTPESICIVAKENGRSKAVFTGDTLFVGDVGRPDLVTSEQRDAQDLAGELFCSLKKLTSLPDDTIMYPGHGAGSSCGKQLGSERFSTIGRQKQFNYALKIQDQREFVKAVCTGQTKEPPYFAHSSKLNKEQRTLLRDTTHQALRQLSVRDVLESARAGAQLLDVRAADAYAAGHIGGSINISLNGRFASWAGTFLQASIPLVIVCQSGQETEAIKRLARVGFHPIGFFPYDSTRASNIRRYKRVSAEELSDLIDSKAPLRILDVRNHEEYEKQQIAGSTLIPLHELTLRASELPKDEPIVVHCQSGYRSAIAMSLLLNQGFENLSELIGGIAEFV